MTRLNRGLAVLLLLLSAALCLAEEPPALLHANLLNSIKLRFLAGELYLEGLVAYNLPGAEATEAAEAFSYAPDTDHQLWAILSSRATTTAADGTVTEQLTPVARFDFYGELGVPPAWQLRAYRLTNLATGERVDGGNLKLAAGQYVMQFLLASGCWYRFPFTVKSLPGNAAAPKPYWQMDGDWNDWGYLFYGDLDPDELLAWKMWLRGDTHAKEKDCKVRVELKRDSDGKLLALNREGYTYTLTPEWMRYALEFVTPPGHPTAGSMFLARDLLATNGNYTLTVALDGKPYGTWKFTVAGGELVLVGRAKTPPTDPLTAIYGGGALWYGRYKPPQ